MIELGLHTDNWRTLSGSFQAAAESAVGLAIFLALFRNRETLNADEISLLRG